jgi:hypothetical protein
MAEQTDVIRQQIDATRESMTEKLQTLEGHVKEAVGTVSETIETVKNTVENVKSGVESTVDTVKETLDVSRQIDRHPWGALGCSFLAGAAAGYLLEPRPRERYDRAPGREREMPVHPAASLAAAHTNGQQPRARSDFMTRIAGAFEAELDKVKQVALGALFGMARDALKDALPESLSRHVTDILNDATRRIGGEPIHGRVLGSESDAPVAGKPA